MIDVHYASLTSQGVQHRVFYLDGHPSRYQPRPTGLNFGEQTGTGVFPLVIAVPPLRDHIEEADSLGLNAVELESPEMFENFPRLPDIYCTCFRRSGVR